MDKELCKWFQLWMLAQKKANLSIYLSLKSDESQFKIFIFQFLSTF